MPDESDVNISTPACLLFELTSSVNKVSLKTFTSMGYAFTLFTTRPRLPLAPPRGARMAFSSLSPRRLTGSRGLRPAPLTPAHRSS